MNESKCPNIWVESRPARAEVHKQSGTVRAGLGRLVLGDGVFQGLFVAASRPGRGVAVRSPGWPTWLHFSVRFPVVAAHTLPSACRQPKGPMEPEESALIVPGRASDLPHTCWIGSCSPGPAEPLMGLSWSHDPAASPGVSLSGMHVVNRTI